MIHFRFRSAIITLITLLTLYLSMSGQALASTGLANPDFDLVIKGLPNGWMLEQAVRNKGSARIVDSYPGASSRVLELQPNSRNTGDRLIGVGQLLDAAPLRGKALTVSIMAGASGGANAVVGLHALGASGDLDFVQLVQDDSGGALRVQQRQFVVPDNANNLVVYAIATGVSGTVVFDRVDVSLAASGTAERASEPSAGNASGAKIRIESSQLIRVIPETIYGTNVEWIFDGQGLWSAAEERLDPGAIELTRALEPTLLRFPGGVFSDFYDWRDGIGPREARPVTMHYPGGPSSRHNFGLPELAEFAEAVGSEVLITVNAGTGTAQDAAEWVRYMNQTHGPAVKWWEIGNELYMADDLSGAHMSPAVYARRFDEFAKAMRAVDPSIRVGAIGGLNYGNYRFIADNRWTETLLRTSAADIDFLAIHNAYAPVTIGVSDSTDPRDVYRAMLAAPAHIQANLNDVSRLVARYETPGRPISLAITEWGPFFHVLPESSWVDHIKTMGSALFVASTLNTFLREPRVELANFFKLADHGFMGWIGRRQGQAAATAPYEAFSLYRRNLGRNLVAVDTMSPTFSSRDLGVVSAIDGVPLLDAVATLDGDTLTVIVTNKSDTDTIEAELLLAGLSGYESVEVETLHAAALDAHTGTELPSIPGLRWGQQVKLERFDRGAPDEIVLSQDSLAGASAQSGVDLALSYDFRPISITSLRFTGVSH